MPTSKKILFQVALDTGAAVKAAAALEQKIVNLSTANKENTKELKKLQATQTAQVAAAQKKAAAVQKSTKETGAESAATKKLEAELRVLNAALDKTRSGVDSVSREIVTNKKTLADARKEQRRFQNESGAVTGSLKEQRLILSRLKEAYSQFSIGVNGTEQEYKELKAQINRVTADINKQEQSIGVFGRNVGNYAGGIKQAFAGIGNLITGGLIAGGLSSIAGSIKDIAAESIALADIQAKADAQLQAGIESTGGAAGRTLEQLKESAQGLQNLTLFGDEQTQEAQSVLLTFTNIREEIFDRTTPAVLDLATKLGTDLKSASIQVGKALNDPTKGVTALGRAGVQFSEDQKSLIKSLVDSGETAKAQAVILEELEKQFGGAAEAAAKAGSGPITQLKNQMSDLKEEIGAELMPAQLELTKVQLVLAKAFVSVVHGVVAFVKALAAVPEFIKENREELILLGIALLTFNAQAIAATANTLRLAVAEKAAAIARGAATAAQWLLNAAMTANPIGLVVTAIGLLAAAFVALYKRSQKFRAGIKATFAALKTIVNNYIDKLKARVLGLGNIFAGIFTFDLAQIKRGLSGLKDSFSKEAGGIGKGAGEAFRGAYQKELDKGVEAPKVSGGEGATKAFKLPGITPEPEPSPQNRSAETVTIEDDRITRRRAELQTELLLIEKGTREELEIKKGFAVLERDEKLNQAKTTIEQKRLIDTEYLVEVSTLESEYLNRKNQEELTAELVKVEERREGFAAELVELETQLANKQITQEEFETERRETEIERLEFDISLLEEGTLKRLELERDLAEQLAEISEGEAQAREATEARKQAAIKATQTEDRKRAEALQDISQARISFARDAAQAVIEQTNEESTAYKVALGIQRAAALAQVALDTQKQLSSINQSAERFAGLAPPVSIALANVYRIAAIGSALARASRIIGQVRGQQFAEGGLLEGPTHEKGGIAALVGDSFPVELEGGEYVINREATARNQGLIEFINADRGRHTFQISPSFGIGGMIPQAGQRPTLDRTTAQIHRTEATDYARLEAIVKGIAAGMPAPEVSIQEFSQAQKRVNIKTDRGSLS